MSIIKTPKDWWDNVEVHWEHLMDVFSRCGAPMRYDEQGHWWSNGIGEEPTRHDKPLPQFLMDLRNNKDHEELHRYFNLCWLAAPDKPYIHEWRGWGVLCDLCSEIWVFDPEEQEQEGDPQDAA